MGKFDFKVGDIVKIVLYDNFNISLRDVNLEDVDKGLFEEEIIVYGEVYKITDKFVYICMVKTKKFPDWEYYSDAVDFFGAYIPSIVEVEVLKRGDEED